MTALEAESRRFLAHSWAIFVIVMASMEFVGGFFVDISRHSDINLKLIRRANYLITVTLILPILLPTSMSHPLVLSHPQRRGLRRIHFNVGCQTGVNRLVGRRTLRLVGCFSSTLELSMPVIALSVAMRPEHLVYLVYTLHIHGRSEVGDIGARHNFFVFVDFGIKISRW